LQGVSRGDETSGGSILFTNYEMMPYSTFGIAMQQQAFLTPAVGVGVGIKVVENLNSTHSSTDLMLCLAIGGFR
jgi:hypothetical protein